MFETFEPLIRNNCGKLFSFAAIGAISMTVVAYQVLSTMCHFIGHIF